MKHWVFWSWFAQPFSTCWGIACVKSNTYNQWVSCLQFLHNSINDFIWSFKLMFFFMYEQRSHFYDLLLSNFVFYIVEIVKSVFIDQFRFRIIAFLILGMRFAWFQYWLITFFIDYEIKVRSQKLPKSISSFSSSFSSTVWKKRKICSLRRVHATNITYHWR